MSRATLEAHEKRVAARRAAEAEEKKRAELRKAVKGIIPKSVLMPTRGRGRVPSGGVSRKEVEAIRQRATDFLASDAGAEALQTEVQRTAIVILLIDGILGTEPWRASGLHGPAIAANARIRFLDNAIRILEDMRRSRGQSNDPQKRLMEGVIDAEVVK